MQRVRFAHSRRLGYRGALALGVAAALVAGLSGSSLAATRQSIPSGPIKVGAVFSLSGYFAAYGASNKAVADAVVAEINNTGGIGGHKVVLDYANDQSSPSGALAAAHQVISEGVSAFIAMGISPDDLSVSALLDKSHIPGIGLLTDDTYEQGAKWPYVFNTYADSATGAVAYGPFLKKIGAKSVGVIYDTTPGSTLFSQNVVKSIKAQGIPVTKQVSFAPTAVDLTTQVEQIKASGASVLVANNIVDFPTLYKALHAVNWSPKMMVTSAAFFDNTSGLGSLKKTTWSTCNVGLHPGYSYPMNTLAILKALKAKGLATPDVVISVLSEYDAMLILKYAIEKNSSLSGPEIVKTIDSIKDKSFSDPTISYTFSAADHEGLTAADNFVCTLTPLDQYGTPTLYNG